MSQEPKDLTGFSGSGPSNYPVPLPNYGQSGSGDFDAPLPGIGISLIELAIMRRDFPEMYASYIGRIEAQAKRDARLQTQADITLWGCLILAGSSVGYSLTYHDPVGLWVAVIIMFLMACTIYGTSVALNRAIDVAPAAISAWKNKGKPAAKGSRKKKG